jgi:metallo-beta-lactamase class B
MPIRPVRRTAPAHVPLLVLLATVWLPAPGQAQSTSQRNPEWTAPQQPLRVYGNSYYVGTRGLASILITSSQGHILIDGTMAEAAPQIAANVRKLGFRMEDVKLILNTHVHFDHAGGIAELQRLSGAVVAASESTSRVLKSGHSGPDDPQFGILPAIPTVAAVRIVKDGETLHVGPLAVTAHFTPGHTRGGTSWTWQSCESARCLNIAYVDSLTAISADNFRFSSNQTYPNVQQDFEKSFTVISALPCDILLTPHPGVSDLWTRLQKRDERADVNALVDPNACKQYAETGRTNLQKRLADEAATAASGGK